MLEEYTPAVQGKLLDSIMEEINDKISYNFKNLCALKNKTDK